MAPSWLPSSPWQLRRLGVHSFRLITFCPNPIEGYVEYAQRARDPYDEMLKEILRIDPDNDVAALTQYLEMAEVMLARALKDAEDLKETGAYAKDDAAAAI